MLTIKKAIRQYQIPVSNLQDWNRWYYQTGLLKYYRLTAFSTMMSSEDSYQLKLKLQETQAQLEKVKLRKTALETMIKVVEQQYKIEVRKKYDSRRLHLFCLLIATLWFTR